MMKIDKKYLVYPYMENDGEIFYTVWGTAKINDKGYYRITSEKEGYSMRYIHHLVWLDHYKRSEIPEGYVIHHKDGDKLNNEISNLQCCRRDLHLRFHKKGEKNPMYGKYHSEESRKKQSKTSTSTGLFKVYKHNDNRLKQGFYWVYQYLKDGEKTQSQITSIDLLKLKEKVIEQGLEWDIVDRKKAEKLCYKYGYKLEDLM